MIACEILIAISLLVGCSQEKSESEVFRKFLISPIPDSVKEIRTDKGARVFGHLYIMRFKINNKDVQLIVDTKALVEYDWVSYWPDAGTLRWGVNPKYPFGKTPKGYNDSLAINIKCSWFRPDQIAQPRVYAKEGDPNELTSPNHSLVLVYDEAKEEAYVVEFYDSGGL